MKIIDGKMTPEKTRQQEMSKDRGKRPKREMYKTDRHWTLDNYKAVRMLSSETKSLQKRKSVTKIQTQEEVERILGKAEHARHLINTEPEKAKCEICKQKNINKNTKVSKDNKKWCKKCRQRNQQHENTCKECGIWEIDMADNRCERCWTTALAEEVIAEREERCVEEKCMKRGTNKFFGHSVCKNI